MQGIGLLKRPETGNDASSLTGPSTVVPPGDQTCQDSAEKQYTDKVAVLPVVMQRQALRRLINQVTKHFAIPQTPYIDKVVDTPVVMHQQVPQVQARAGDGGRPASEVHRQRERACDNAGDQACRDSADSAHRQGRRRAGGDATTGSSASDCAKDRVDDVPVPQILNEIVEVGKAQKMVPRERISERICEQIVDAPVSHSQPQISKEVVEVVKAVKKCPSGAYF